MSLLVRAIVRAADAERALAGELVAVRDGDLAAIASPREDLPAADERELRTHHALASRIHDAAPSLPSRFGQAFADETALRAALGARRAALRSALESVGDRVEVAITLAWRAPVAAAPEIEPRTGREFLESRAVRERVRRRADALVERLLATLGGERAVSRSSCPREGVAAIVGLLIERHEVGEVREAVRAFASGEPDVVASVSGPMPPYSFAS